MGTTYGAPQGALATFYAQPTPQPLGYRGYVYDVESHAYWLSVRQYDPQLKRFLQPDPSEQEGVLSYVYCGDNPIDCSDPSGLTGGPGSLQNQIGKVAVGDVVVTQEGVEAAVQQDAARSPTSSLEPIDTAQADQAPRDSGKGSTHKVTIELNFKQGWTTMQRAAAQAKVDFLNRARAIRTPATRGNRSTSTMFTKAGGTVPSGSDVDHMLDLQLRGADAVTNMSPLDLSVNRSLGPQIYNQIKDLPIGTTIDRFTIED